MTIEQQYTTVGFIKLCTYSKDPRENILTFHTIQLYRVVLAWFLDILQMPLYYANKPATIKTVSFYKFQCTFTPPRDLSFIYKKEFRIIDDEISCTSVVSFVQSNLQEIEGRWPFVEVIHCYI